MLGWMHAISSLHLLACAWSSWLTTTHLCWPMDNSPWTFLSCVRSVYLGLQWPVYLFEYQSHTRLVLGFARREGGLCIVQM